MTILSRCQRYDFRRISIDTIADRMRELMDAEHVQIEERALRYIAKAADGSMRDGLSLLDQCIAFHLGQELTYDKVLDVLGAVDTEVFSRLFRSLLATDALKCITILEEIVMQGRELVQFVSDFAWYMRNLMLAKSTDEIEDVIDVSSENLARLKEEAEMADMETIMRYIRIFSELSNQVRYASQKRILIELALIKMCRPAMETSQDAILDRIRQLEDKMEHASFLPEGMTPDMLMTSQPGAPAVKKARPELPKAIPEEVEKIVKSWPSIVGDADNPMKTYLKTARLSLGGDNRLMVVLPDGLASDYFQQNEENREALKRLLGDFSGKDVDVNFQSVKSEREFEDSFVDISKILNMEVEVED